MEYKKNIAMVISGEFPTNSRIIDKIRSAEKVIAVDGATNTLIDQGVIPSIARRELHSIRLSYNDKACQTVQTEAQKII